MASIIQEDNIESTEESVKANNVPIAPREVFRFQKSEPDINLEKLESLKCF